MGSVTVRVGEEVLREEVFEIVRRRDGVFAADIAREIRRKYGLRVSSREVAAFIDAKMDRVVGEKVRNRFVYFVPGS